MYNEWDYWVFHRFDCRRVCRSFRNGIMQRSKGGLNMEFNDIVTAISTVGFPIVACGALYYMINTTMKELKEVIENLDKTISTLIVKKDD